MGLLRAEAAKSVRERSGAGAVRQSVQQNTMQSNVTAVAIDGVEADQQVLVRNSMQNQFVANKNFFSQGNVWVDAEFKPELKQMEVNLKFASDEYFALVSRERELAQWFALGEEVVVVWKNKVYRVTK